MTLKIKAFEFTTIAEALAWLDADGRGKVITVADKVLVVDEVEANRIETAGIEFAYIYEAAMPDETYRTISVPVNC